MSAAPPLPVAPRRFIGGVLVVGAAVLIRSLSAAPFWNSVDLLALGALFAGTVLAEQYQVELPYRTERLTFSLADSLYAAGLLLARPSVLVVALAAGVAVGQGVQTWAPVKVAFNVGQTLIAIGLATLVFDWLGRPSPTEPIGWLAAAAAIGVFHLTTAMLTSTVIAFIDRLPLRSASMIPSGFLLWAGNVVLGILGAVVWALEPLALPLLLVPLLLTFLAYQGWMSTIRQRDQMHEMATTAGSISAGGDLSKRLPETGTDDEVWALSTTLNDMLGRLDRSFARERLFIRETSHELRTPITICRGHLELMGPDAPPEEVKETITLVVDELDRMARIVQDMGTLARMEDPASLRCVDVSIDRLMSGVAIKAVPLLDGRLHVEPAPADAVVKGDPQRLTQALINLINNTAEHTPPGTAVDMRAFEDGGAWRFEVADNGGGIPVGKEEDVFHPFYAGKGSSGSGLGLAIITGIARAHGGSAGVVNRPGQGATFWVRVPK